MRKVDPPMIERWELPEGEFPEAITIDGMQFHRAIRKQPYEGVIEQYREAVPKNSAHLFVTNDGHWIIDHIDEYNPDLGFPVRHFIVDHPRGGSVLVAGLGVLGLAGSALVGLGEKNNAKETDGRSSRERNSGSR